MSPKTRLAEKKEKAGASEKKKNAAVKRKEAAAKRRAAVKKKREAAKRSETTKKKRKRDSGLDGGSSSNPTKRTRNRVRETAGSPPENEGPEKSPTPTHAANEAENPQQPRVTSGSSTKSPSHRVDEQNDEEIGSNNRDPNTPEVAVDNEAPRTVERDMTVEADRPAGAGNTIS
ncbi:neuromodulin-like [Raphanus sativus]|nr:neuromodulin-like [Raphanus sativus]KAJ4912481.1 neuromodulin-like [Raphanus sativus]